MFNSAPVPNLNNAQFSVIVPNVVGGGSIVNGMVYDRGARADYDAWEKLGNPGWNFNGLLPYFKRSTTFTPPSPAKAREFDMTWDPAAYGNGPVQITLTNFQFPDLKPFWAAWKTEGVPLPKDPNLGQAVGAYWTPSNTDVRDGTRSSSTKAYYKPNASRPNLRLLTGQTVTQILFDGLTAKGVRYVSKDNKVTDVFARKEVILAAGAIATPKLLQSSGIGPKSVLQAAGVTVKKDLPAVGANFQDHPWAIMLFNLNNTSFPDPNTINVNATYNASVWQEYNQYHTGQIATSRGNTLTFLSLPQVTSAFQAIVKKLKSQNPLTYLPSIYGSNTALLNGFKAQRDILIKSLGGNDGAVVEYPVPAGGFGTLALQKPLSRGTIGLDPANPSGPPIVQYNTLMNPVDTDVLVASVRRNRKYWSNALLKKFSPVETLPGAQASTDQQIIDAFKGLLQPSFAHPSGSCAMMSENLGGCVSSQLLVYGTKKLSIVDASILPLIPACHLQATMYGVAEKAADIIKSRA